MAVSAIDEMTAAIDRSGSPLCVGLDPDLDRLPGALSGGDEAARLERFSRGVIDAVGGAVGIVKPQSACYERFGSAGVRSLEATVSAARDRGLFVLLDVKRGDIGVSARHYAAAAAAMGAHAATVSPYLGLSAIEPFLHAGLAVFVLVRTTNPDAAAVQDLGLADGGGGGHRVRDAVAAAVADLGGGWVGSRGLSALGAVVGLGPRSTPEDDRAMRGLMPTAPLLCPGLGAQGGSAEQLTALARPGAGSLAEAGVIPSASRSVIYPDLAPGSGVEAWQAAVAGAARRSAAEVAAALRPVLG